MNLAERVMAGDRQALARALSLVENRWDGWFELMRQLASAGKARVVGITGAAGTGKSTLTGELARLLLAQGHRVAIVAIDPSSPISGGALLGDRVRMPLLAESGAFIRSLATRGALGGLCDAARDVVKLLEAAGYGIILIETVGVGQDEVDVMRLAGQVVVLCIPGQGDGVQAVKAGLMEIGDIFVVNKADNAGANRVVTEIKQMLSVRSDVSRRERLVLRTVAKTGEGVAFLADAVLAQPENGAGVVALNWC